MIVGLIRGRRWAWWSALAIAIVTVSVAVFLLIATLRPRDDFARSGGEFGLFISLCLMVPGAVSAQRGASFSKPFDVPLAK